MEEIHEYIISFDHNDRQMKGVGVTMETAQNISQLFMFLVLIFTSVVY